MANKCGNRLSLETEIKELDQPVPVEVLCVQCHKTKSNDCFYKRTSIRRDSTCIDCRRKERRDRYQKQIQPAQKNLTAPKRIIEPKKSVAPRHESMIHETNEIVQRSDFGDMEKVYGKLGSHERYEIVQGFNEFVSLLREGYSELMGSNIYVRKD